MERRQEWNREVRLPDTVNQIAMQAVVLGYFAVCDTIDKLYEVERSARSTWLEDLAGSLKSFESRALRDMKTYAGRTETGRWVLSTGLPVWVAAGMECGILNNGDLTLKGPSTLWIFCGMEHRRYTPTEQIREIMTEVLGQHPQNTVTDAQLQTLGTRLDRHPGPLLGRNPTRQEVFKWANKRRYSEFLRVLAIRLGEWIQNNKQNIYHEIYVKSLEKEGEQALVENGSSVTLSDLERYARTTAVRQFLSDYYARYPIVLQGSTPRC